MIAIITIDGTNEDTFVIVIEKHSLYFYSVHKSRPESVKIED
ncbi:MAG: hypothetical protein AAGJ12_02990 [Bacteroidota bacterium]|nr:hypothetical protein [uncultured Allomuricauda sp.]